MQTFWTIQHMFPNANKGNVEVTVFPDESWEITKWNLPDSKPSKDDIINYWNTNQQAILDANQPPPTEIDDLKKQQADLTFSLMIKGVL